MGLYEHVLFHPGAYSLVSLRLHYVSKKKAFYVVENPVSSMVFDYPCVQVAGLQAHAVMRSPVLRYHELIG